MRGRRQPPTHAAFLNLQNSVPLHCKLQMLLDKHIHSTAPFQTELSRCVCTEIPREWTYALQSLSSSNICYYPHVLSSWWARPQDCEERWPACALDSLAFNSLPQTQRVKAALVDWIGGWVFNCCWCFFFNVIKKLQNSLLRYPCVVELDLCLWGVMLLQQETPPPGLTAPGCCLKGCLLPIGIKTLLIQS